MKLIVVIDDSGFHRRLARHELAHSSGIVIPETVAEVGWLDPQNIGLLILDRHMGASWKQAAERLLARITPDCEVVEWTAGTQFDDLERWPSAICAVSKIDSSGELEKLVNRWIRTGTVRQPVTA
tara:strand:- start:160 stop:534 length:375 start_codon:yes stop_codon:yes gene_type:complete